MPCAVYAGTGGNAPEFGPIRNPVAGPSLPARLNYCHKAGNVCVMGVQEMIIIVVLAAMAGALLRRLAAFLRDELR